MMQIRSYRLLAISRGIMSDLTTLAYCIGQDLERYFNTLILFSSLHVRTTQTMQQQTCLLGQPHFLSSSAFSVSTTHFLLLAPSMGPRRAGLCTRYAACFFPKRRIYFLFRAICVPYVLSLPSYNPHIILIQGIKEDLPQ